MPPVLATTLFVAVLGLAWRWARHRPETPADPSSEPRGPTEIIDTVPLMRDADGFWRPRAHGAHPETADEA